MYRVGKLLILLLANIVIAVGCLGAVAVIPPLLNDSRMVIVATMIKTGWLKESGTDKQAAIANYKSHPWARKHFSEFAKLSSDYYDFIGWRRRQFNGDTITIDKDGYRIHGSSAGFDNSVAWFFGGSTMWGTGAHDKMTIPAYFQQQSSRQSFNFGETAYTAHQSLNLLMKVYLGDAKPKHVVFYDGVNEVLHKCRRELTFFSSAREAQIRDRMKNQGSSHFVDLKKVFSPTIELLQTLQSSVSKAQNNELYDCASDRTKARQVASALLGDWSVAKHIVETNGGSFYPILQPVAFVGTPTLHHLPDWAKRLDLQKQYQTVYAEIVALARERNFRFYDLTDIFNGDELFYVDFCHVSPNGNQRVATALREIIKDSVFSHGPRSPEVRLQPAPNQSAPVP